MANFSRQTHINDPDQTVLRGESLGRNGPGKVSLLNKVPFNRFSNTNVNQQQLDNMYQPACPKIAELKIGWADKKYDSFIFVLFGKFGRIKHAFHSLTSAG